MITEITNMPVREIEQIAKDYPNGHVESRAGKVVWVWEESNDC